MTTVAKVWDAATLISTLDAPLRKLPTTTSQTLLENFRLGAEIYVVAFSASQTETRELTWSIARKLLGLALNTSPQHLNFSKTSQGKPYLVEHQNFDFSISHTRGYGAVALSSNSRVGVDIEGWPSRKRLEKISSRYFSQEILNESRLQMGNPDGQEVFLLQVWTVLEAIVKCKGSNLFHEIGRIDLDPKSFYCRQHPEITIHTQIHHGQCLLALATAPLA